MLRKTELDFNHIYFYKCVNDHETFFFAALSALSFFHAHGRRILFPVGRRGSRLLLKMHRASDLPQNLLELILFIKVP
jgi:hypothetical protein